MFDVLLPPGENREREVLNVLNVSYFPPTHIRTLFSIIPETLGPLTSVAPPLPVLPSSVPQSSRPNSPFPPSFAEEFFAGRKNLIVARASYALIVSNTRAGTLFRSFSTLSILPHTSSAALKSIFPPSLGRRVHPPIRRHTRRPVAHQHPHYGRDCLDSATVTYLCEVVLCDKPKQPPDFCIIAACSLFFSGHSTSNSCNPAGKFPPSSPWTNHRPSSPSFWLCQPFDVCYI
jgi:hypothetical protein